MLAEVLLSLGVLQNSFKYTDATAELIITRIVNSTVDSSQSVAK